MIICCLRNCTQKTQKRLFFSIALFLSFFLGFPHLAIFFVSLSRTSLQFFFFPPKHLMSPSKDPSLQQKSKKSQKPKSQKVSSNFFSSHRKTKSLSLNLPLFDLSPFHWIFLSLSQVPFTESSSLWPKSHLCPLSPNPFSHFKVPNVTKWRLGIRKGSSHSEVLDVKGIEMLKV